MPKADPLIVQWFHKLGRGLSDGMGLTPITFTELNSFPQVLNLNITPWECEQLITMSREYCGMIHKAKDKNCKCPWHSDKYDARQSAAAKVERQLDELFR